MDAPLYDIYLTGKLADGVSADQAGARLAQLFKSSPQAMAALLTGSPRLLKRGVERATALKYREALGRAGVGVAFKQRTADEAATEAARAPAASAPPAPAAAAGLTLAPAGTEVLTAAERRAPAVAAAAADIDTSRLGIAPAGDLPGARGRPAAPPPDVGHIHLAPTGAELLTAQERRTPAAAVAAGDWTLAPAGAVLDTLRDDAPALNPDTSRLALAPAGAELLSARERHRETPPAPDTGHLRLADPAG